MKTEFSMETPRIPDSQIFGHWALRSRSGERNEVFKSRNTTAVCQVRRDGIKLDRLSLFDRVSEIRRCLDQTHF